MIQTLVSIPFRIALIIFSVFEIKGLENIRNLDTSRGLILAANHNSQLDSLALSCSIPLISNLGPVYFVSLEPKHYDDFPIGKYFYGGLLFLILGAYPIKRGLRDYGSTLATHAKLLRKGKTVCIYPEGKRVPGKELGEGHGGVAYLGHTTGAPIVPVAITGDEDITPLDFFTFRCHLRLTFGKPLYFHDIDVSDAPADLRYHAAAQNVMVRIKNLLTDLLHD